MNETVTLVGLDFGTTTSCASIASARLACHSATGRIELRDVDLRYCSEHVFTPFLGEQLDEVRLAEHLEQWLKDVRETDVFGGGAMITGLAAQASNAAGFASQIRRRLKNAVVAVAADPCLESWLAFMGNCSELSRANPSLPFLNLDIGGGTTNVALGRNAEVLQIGSYSVGARHLQFVPGTYRITAVSRYARPLLKHVGIRKGIGDTFTESEVLAIVDWYLSLLESLVTGCCRSDDDPLTALHRQVPFDCAAENADCAVTLSGGVGYLAYRALRGHELPDTTAFGDLGIDLARRLVQREIWRQRLTQFVPCGLGRATLFGLLRHQTQVSGSTLHLNDSRILPLSDLVILGSLSPASPPAEVDRLVVLAARTARGACLRIDLAGCDRASICLLADQLRTQIESESAFQHIPLVLLVRENLGKVLGQWVTNWGRSSVKVVVIDEIDLHDTQFASIGRLHQGVVPLSLFGMNAVGGSS